jgi:hypothetical protein
VTIFLVANTNILVIESEDRTLLCHNPRTGHKSAHLRSLHVSSTYDELHTKGNKTPRTIFEDTMIQLRPECMCNYAATLTKEDTCVSKHIILQHSDL